MVLKRRDSDNRWHKIRRFIYGIGGVSLGWSLRGWFPEDNAIQIAGRFFNLTKDTIKELAELINLLGGLPAVIAAIVSITTLWMKFHKKRKTNGD